MGVEITGGQSGYFSTPSNALDPRLFDGDQIRPNLRTWILNTLSDFWAFRYDRIPAWATVWLAGSGISYQWAADRGNGDLDVLIGIDWPTFFEANPVMRGLSSVEAADQINAELHSDLWPKTANTPIGHGNYVGNFEVTFYVNPGGTDIRDINPYAAYDLTHNRWTVKPPVLPENPETLYPTEWWDWVHGERRMADSLIEHYNQAQATMVGVRRGTPRWSTGKRQLDIVASQITALYDDIHGGRRAAFSEQGEGYGDFHNFRWQAHKRFGTAQALHEIATARKTGLTEYEAETYGAPLSSAQETLRAAALYARRYPV